MIRKGEKMKAINIKWDTFDPGYQNEDINLPNEIEIPQHLTNENDENIEEIISDYLSDVTGFCHHGFYLIK